MSLLYSDRGNKFVIVFLNVTIYTLPCVVTCLFSCLCLDYRFLVLDIFSDLSEDLQNEIAIFFVVFSAKKSSF